MVDETPPEAIVLMKMALGLIDVSSGRATPVARHLNAAIELAMDQNHAKPALEAEAAPGVSLQAV